MKRQTLGPTPRTRLGVLLVGMAVFAASFLLSYPRTIAIMDEDAYLTQALLFRAGRLTYEGSSIPAPHMTVEMAGHLACKYPPGNSIWLLPFTLAGWRTVFASGLILALAGTIVFALVLRRLDPEIDPAWALCWLCYPTVALFSRTVMSDLLSATCVLIAFYFLLRRGRWLLLSGLALGYGLLVRYANAVLAVPFLMLILLSGIRRVRSLLWFAAGLAPFCVGILAYNTLVFGGPLRFPMHLTGFFSWVFLPINVPYYAVNLLLLYPAMLASPFLAGRGRRLLLALPAFSLVLLYCFFSFVHEVPNLAERLTIGMRYLLPALPFFVVGFCLSAEELVRRVRGMGIVKYAGIGLLLVSSVAIHVRHDRYLRVQEDYQRRLYAGLPADALLICNNDVSELISYAWGWREWRHFAEFDVPIPLTRALAAPKLYAAMLEKPGDERGPERAVFNSILAGFPDRELVAETASPYRFSLYRLRWF